MEERLTQILTSIAGRECVYFTKEPDSKCENESPVFCIDAIKCGNEKCICIRASRKLYEYENTNLSPVEIETLKAENEELKNENKTLTQALDIKEKLMEKYREEIAELKEQLSKVETAFDLACYDIRPVCFYCKYSEECDKVKTQETFCKSIVKKDYLEAAENRLAELKEGK